MEKTEVLIFGVCLENLFLDKRGKKLGCVLYTGVHYTQVNTVPCQQKIQLSTLSTVDTAIYPVNNRYSYLPCQQ